MIELEIKSGVRLGMMVKPQQPQQPQPRDVRNRTSDMMRRNGGY